MDTGKDPRDVAVNLLKRSVFKVQVAAVLVDTSGNIFSWGWNHPTPDGFTKHAERAAIERANHKRLYGSRMIVAGKKRKSNNWVYSKPCTKKCLPMLEALGIREVEFITKAGHWEVFRLEWIRVR